MSTVQTKRKGSSFNALSFKRRLESVFLFTTGKCNAKCAMCFYANEMEKKQPDLGFEEIKKITETAGELNRLYLSGGEPTMREDLPEILELFYRNNHVKDINFPSNGMKPDRLVEWIKRLRQSCPDCNIVTSISLDGFGETHDTQRGVTSFYKALETLKKIDEHFKHDGKVIKNIGTVITKYNVRQIQDFMTWVYGRLNLSAHTLEAARGMTREDGVKILTEQSLCAIQDEAAPFHMLYAKRIGAEMGGLARGLTKFFYVGLMRAMYNMRAQNLERPTCWGMDCTAGETTLVIDYDGRFRACELRDPLGNVKDYGCDVQAIMNSGAMKNEIAAIGHGYKANCWCTHGCWLMSSITFNPGKMVSKLFQGYNQTKRLLRPIDVSETRLRTLEDQYHLDRNKLQELGIA